MQLFEYTFQAMSTLCSIKLYTPSEKKAETCFLEIKKNTLLLEQKYNFYNKNSYLNQKINQRRGNKVVIDRQTHDVLKQVHELSLVTQGVFDISVGTLKSCYQLDTLEKVEACLEKKQAYTGLNSWYLEDRNLRFKDKRTLLDLGGVIKEYAVDEAVKIAKKHNITAALINYGGDIFAYGTKDNAEPFSIGIKDPKNPHENIAIVPLSNQALTTSANYERNHKIEGKEFSHIINNSLRKRSKNQIKIISSTIISDSVLRSGVYSTVFMLDMDIDIPKEMGVILVDEAFKLHQNILQ